MTDPNQNIEQQLTEMLDNFMLVHGTRNARTPQSKVELKAEILALVTSKVNQARQDELERLQHTKWVDLAYDIPGYLKDRLSTLKKGKE